MGAVGNGPGREWLEVSAVNIKVKSIAPLRSTHAANECQSPGIDKRASILVSGAR